MYCASSTSYCPTMSPFIAAPCQCSRNDNESFGANRPSRDDDDDDDDDDDGASAASVAATSHSTTFGGPGAPGFATVVRTLRHSLAGPHPSWLYAREWNS